FRNFANKIWNATRFCLMNSEGAVIKSSPPYEGGVAVPTSFVGADGVVLSSLSLPDRWIISRLNKTAKAVNYALQTYQFHEAVQLLYHFFWDDFCDWYIELKKDEITTGSSAGSEPPALAGGLNSAKVQARTTLLTVLEQALRMLHPFMPYLTEELWQKLPGVSSQLH